MKKILFVFTVFIIALATSCGSSVSVSYDYDKSVDFTKYKTYNYTEDAKKLGVNDLVRDRIFNAIDKEMSTRGLSKSDTPDSWVDVLIKAQERTEATATNTGGGMYGGRYGYAGGFGGTTHVSYNQYVDGTMFINLIDKTSEKIVWQGVGTKTLDEKATPEKRDTNITYAVNAIFKNYPVKPPVKK